MQAEQTEPSPIGLRGGSQQASPGQLLALTLGSLVLAAVLVVFVAVRLWGKRREVDGPPSSRLSGRPPPPSVPPSR